MNDALRLFEGAKSLAKLCRELKRESATVRLEELVGGALSSYSAAAIARVGGVHLFVAEEMLAMRLAVMHNLYFYNKLMERIRHALDEGTFAQFRNEYSEKLARRI